MNNDKTKNNIIIGLLIVIVLMFSFFVSTDNNNELSDSETQEEQTESTEDLMALAQAESDSVKDEETKEFNEITIDEYITLLEGAETKIVLLGSDTCSYCEIAEPIIKNVSYIYDVEINYLNTSTFSADDEANFVRSNENFSEGYGTPTIFVVQNNQVIDIIKGLTTSEVYTEFLKNNGFVK